MATVTSLKFDITSGWSGTGVDDAQEQIKALKQQIDDLNSKRLQITADATETQAVIADVKKQIDDLNQDIKLGVADEDAKTKLLELKAELDALNNRSLAIKVDKSQADAEMAALKLEMDRLSDKTIKVKGDTSDLRKSFDDAKNSMDDDLSSMQDAWKRTQASGQASLLTLWSGLLLMLPVLVPIAAGVLYVGAAAVSAFGSAAIAGGLFAAVLGGQLKNAFTTANSLQTLNNTYTSQQQVLGTLTKGSSAYNSQLKTMAGTQAQMNTLLNANGPIARQNAQDALQLKGQWQDLQSTMAKSTGPYMSSIFKAMGQSMKALPPIMAAVATALEPMRQKFNEFFTATNNKDLGVGLQEFVNWVIAVGVPNFKNLVTAGANIVHVITDMAVAFSGPGLSMTQWLAKVTGYLSNWSTGGGFERFIASMHDELPKIEQSLKSFGGALGNVIKALQDGGSAELTAFSIAMGLLAKLPVGAIQGLFLAFAGYKVIAAASTVVNAAATAVKGIQVAYGAAQLAVAGFQLAQEGANVTSKDGVAAQIGAKVAMAGSAVATGINTVATWLFAGAMTAADVTTGMFVATIGILLVAVAAIGIGVYELVKHWSTVWGEIKRITADVFGWLEANWKTVLEIMLVVLTGGLGIVIAAAIRYWGAIKQAFDDAWTWLKNNWKTVMEIMLVILTGGLGIIVAASIRYWGAVLQAAQTVWDALKTAWTTTLDAFKTAWDTVSSALISAWNTVWNALKAAGQSVWDAIDTAWTTVLNALKTTWDTVSNALTSAWDNIWNALKAAGQTVWDALGSAWSTVVNGIKTVWDTVSNTLSSAWGNFWSGLRGAASTVWTDIKNGAAQAWRDIANAFVTPVNFVINTVWNNGIAKIWNDTAGAIGLPKLPAEVQIPKMATGGLVSGPGGPKDDKVPVWLSNKEFVLNADATDHYGISTLYAMNQKKIAMAEGGLVRHAGMRLAGGDTGPGSTAQGVQTGGSGTANNNAAQAAVANQNAKNTAADVAGGGISVTSLAKFVNDITGGLVGDAIGAAMHGLVDPLINSIPGASGVKNLLVHGMDKILAAAIGKVTAGAAATSIGGVVPTGEHKTDIDQALAKASIPQDQWPKWETGLNTLITRESGWNSGAINRTDSNAAAGHPSQGLMQTIPSTFAAYSLGGSITDPVSNIVAGIRYIIATYGDISKVQQANANLPAKGYDLGGALLPGMTLANNTTGSVEGVLNPTGLAAIGGLGSLSSLNSGAGFRSTGGSTGSGGGNSGGTVVSINAPITIVAGDGATAEEVAAMVEAEFEKLAVMIETEVGTR